MEHQPPQPQGGELQPIRYVDEPLAPPASTEQEPDNPSDGELIARGIAAAQQEARPIDHATARVIATQLHGGQASALYALSATGALSERLAAELDDWRHKDSAEVDVEPWLRALHEYLQERADPTPVAGWDRLWPPGSVSTAAALADEPAPEGEGPPALAHRNAAPLDSITEDEESLHADLFRRISAAGARRLGDSATIATAAAEEINEDDDFSWIDAAEWNATEVARTTDVEADDAAAVNELFDRVPDDELGSVHELGWYGRIAHGDRRGGIILIQDVDGFRRVREVLDDDDLDRQWNSIRHEYETFYAQQDAYAEATTDTDDAPSGYNPKIWVGSLADYNAGVLYGAWMDATLDPDVLEAAIAYMLRTGPTRSAEEWAIFDHDGFADFEVGEYENLHVVSQIAQGVACHGPAFGAWAELVGTDDRSLLDIEAFLENYEGEWHTLTDYVEYVLAETGFAAQLEQSLAPLPEDLRQHIKVDVEGIAEEWAQGLHVVSTGDDRVWIFTMSR